MNHPLLKLFLIFLLAFSPILIGFFLVSLKNKIR